VTNMLLDCMTSTILSKRQVLNDHMSGVDNLLILQYVSQKNH